MTTQRTPLADRDPHELARFLAEQQQAYADLQARGLALDLTRGKPSSEQLDLSDELRKLPDPARAADGTDVRNYGILAGLPEMRAIFGDLLGVPAAQVVAGGSSSLTMMHEVLVQLLLHGAPDGRPWSAQVPVRFICPVPGYDRHFAMLAAYGIEMIPVDMREDGPDADAIAAIVADDPSVKGMWVVPTYANPTGSVTTTEVARALAEMPTAAPDFRILWDNAYVLHHLTETETRSADILGLCAEAGHPDRAIVFASTSKITYAGAGVACLAASPTTVAWYLDRLQWSSIGPDKVNQLRHVQFFGDADGVRTHMAKHRAILAPKFQAVLEALEEQLGGLGVATWTRPIGGYFVSLDVLDGTATRVVQLAKEAGISLTPAGSAFPHGQDPRGRNIRLAPSFPPLAEVRTAMAGVATCVALAAAESLTGR